jgi:hypothetical protein
MELSEDIKNELDIRLEILEKENTELYSWEEVKVRLKALRTI